MSHQVASDQSFLKPMVSGTYRWVLRSLSRGFGDLYTGPQLRGRWLESSLASCCHGAPKIRSWQACSLVTPQVESPLEDPNLASVLRRHLKVGERGCNLAKGTRRSRVYLRMVSPVFWLEPDAKTGRYTSGVATTSPREESYRQSESEKQQSVLLYSWSKMTKRISAVKPAFSTSHLSSLLKGAATHLLGCQ